MRRSLLVALVLLAGCASIPRLKPNPVSGEREDQIIATPVGIGVHVIPNAWKGSPENVAEHFTPIWIHLVNKGDQAYDITFAGMTLIDEQGRLYAAVPPAEVVRATIGSDEREPGGVLVADASDSDVQAPLLAQVGFGFGMGPSYYDPNSPLNPYAYGPDSVGYADAARAIVTGGLREGRLLPKTQAMGFVFFQRAYDAKELHLRIDAQPEVQGAAPLEMQANFTVAH